MYLSFHLANLGLFAIVFSLTNFAAAAIGQEPTPEYLQEEMTARPTPDWVQMIDQGQSNPALDGLRTPAGIQVDVVAEEPVLIDPVGMTFDEDGTPYVLEWRKATEQVDVSYTVTYQDGTTAIVNRKVKNARDQLKRLVDQDNDGVYDRSEVVMDDLEYPSTVLIHNDWFYFPSVGHVIRRHRTDEGSFDQEQEILRGMCGYHHHQVSGLTLSHDDWMYTTTGDDDNRTEGSDGSRATVLRTGAIFGSRPDGSQVFEFARGFRNPYRSIVFDERFNMFHVDNDQEDGSKFQGVRLMHLLEGADYGWRLQMGAKCCRTDFARGAVFGERPGKMPSMLKVGRGAPAGLLIYQQTAFPDFFRGILIYPDVYRRLVRAYVVERQGSSFRVAQQFVLMESDDDLFRPVQAIAGPDGAIYVLDWRTDSGGAGKSWGDDQHGRLYRLSWKGIDGHPAIPLGSRTAWADLPRLDDDQLFALLSDPDFELRLRAQMQLAKRGERLLPRWLSVLSDVTRPDTERALALGAASQFYRAKVQTALLERLRDDPSFEIRRLAAEGLGRNTAVPLAMDESLLSGLLQATQSDSHPAVQRAAALSAGQVAASYPAADRNRQVVAQQLYDQLKRIDPEDVWLHDGILRGLERCGPAGIDLLVERVRSANSSEREFAISLFEALRERTGAAGLDQILAGDTKPLTDDQVRRLIETYRHILVDPPVEAIGLQTWIAQHPDAPATVRVAALETLGMIGGSSTSAAEQFALTLLDDADAKVRQSAVRAIGQLRIIGATPALVEALTDARRDTAEQREIIESLSMLRAEGWPFLDRADQGVELMVDPLVKLLDDERLAAVQADLLSLVGQIEIGKAMSPAEKMLVSGDAASVGVAIDVLSSERDWAKAIATRFLEGQFPATAQSHVAAGLQRHLSQDASGEMAALSAELFRNGLNVSLDPAEIERITHLVETTGNPQQGQTLFLNVEKTQCGKCHRLEGVGGQIGPDLTRVWQTHSIAKLLESIVQPSREIKEGFTTWTLETTSGQVFAGLRITDNPREVVLKDTNGREVRVPRAQVEDFAATQTSLMPEGTINQLSFTELIDLLAFLKNADAQRELRNQAP